MVKKRIGTKRLGILDSSIKRLKNIGDFVNPIAHLGEIDYSFNIPFWFTVFACVLIELYAYFIARDPESIGQIAIFTNISLVIYFSLRWGQIGGFSSTSVAFLYYIYIIFSRNYQGERYEDSLVATIIFTFVYFMLAFVIGWLKKTIDTLINREANGRKRLETIIEQLPVGVVIADKDGKIQQTNNLVSRMFGKDIPDGLGVDEPVQNIINPKTGVLERKEDFPLYKALHKQVETKGKELVIKNNRKKHVLVSATPIYDGLGNTVAAVSILQDITNLKELEKRKDDFINMASHELKTPITSLVLYLDIVKKKLAKKDIKAANFAIEGIQNQANNLMYIINTLLDVSRIQIGKSKFVKEDIRIDELVQSVVKDFQNGKSNQTIKVIKKSNLNVNIDPKRIYQVISNLINNAIKYSHGKGDIKISIDKRRNRAVVSVKDHGIGIKKEQQKKIFSKLYQVSDNHGDTFPGLGMGLYISNEIIKQHDGRIWVKSALGKGATFYFSLPIV